MDNVFISVCNRLDYFVAISMYLYLKHQQVSNFKRSKYRKYRQLLQSAINKFIYYYNLHMSSIFFVANQDSSLLASLTSA